ncbi:MAG: rhomboid family intramembrane serine protease [Lachnospiraceae bacterium]|nr:rhomboid family intramembrane serine protease [Lachnospiraceae bacterium]
MYAEFTKTLCQQLIANDYHIVSAKNNIELTRETPIVAMVRNLSPVLYVVNIINADIMPLSTVTKVIEPLNYQMEKSLQKLNCSYAVCLNLLVTSASNDEVQAYIDEKQIVTGEKINQVWWKVNISLQQLVVGKNQPTKIVSLAEIIKQSFLQNGNVNIYSNSNENLNTLEHEYRAKSKLPVLTYNIHATISLIFINIIVWAFLKLTGSEASFIMRFANDSQRVINNQEYYRLITSMFLHGGITHLGYNCLSLYIFGSRAEKYLGKISYLLIYFISGLFSSIASVYFTGGISVGASGAIFGIIGAMIVFTGSNRREMEGLNFFTILLWAIAGIAMGFVDISVDNFAHLGGIATGLIIEWINIKFINTKG